MRTLLALLLLAPAARSQTWAATASTAAEAVHQRDDLWTESRAAVTAQGARLAGTAEAGWTERYDQGAAFVGADLYPVLTEGVYANVRSRWAPGSDVTARLDLGAEAFVALGRGWEASAGGRRLAFADRTVWIASAGGARYVGPWYLRAQVSAVPDEETLPVSARLVVRHLDGDGGSLGDHWEVSAERGQEAVVEADGRTAIRDSWRLAGRVQRRLVGAVGGSAGLGYVADEALSRLQVEAGVSLRW